MAKAQSTHEKERQRAATEIAAQKGVLEGERRRFQASGHVGMWLLLVFSNISLARYFRK